MLEGYELDWTGGDIIARGPQKLRDLLVLIPGARTATEGSAPAIRLPSLRENFLAVEAAGAPTATTDVYRRERQRALAAPFADVVAVCERLAEISVSGRPTELLAHQWQFLAHAYRRHGTLNASEQGTGKTRAAWLMAPLWDAQRILILCPKSLVPQWRQEWAAMWLQAPPMTILTLGDGEVRHRQEIIMDLIRQRPYTPDPVALVVNYETVHTMQKTLAAWEPDLIIGDESWRLKTPTAAVTKAALKLAEGVHQRAGHILLLTGTPVGNHVGDLYTQVRMCDPSLVPAGRGAYSQFLHRYAKMVMMDVRGFREWKPVGCADPAGLMRQIAPVWFRATKATCLDLPPKHHTRVKLPLRRDTAALYKEVAKHGATALGADLCLDGELTTMIHLQRLAGGFKSLPQNEFGHHWFHEPLPCPKIDWLQQWARDTLLGNPTARAIVWCKFRREIERVAGELEKILGLGRVLCAWGGLNDDVLERGKQEFNARTEDGVQVIVAQWNKMAYGHNLQACDTNIFFSHTWSYVERAQAEDRSHRHGRAEAVHYIDLVAEGTIDEDIMKAMERKTDLAARLTPETVATTP